MRDITVVFDLESLDEVEELFFYFEKYSDFGFFYTKGGYLLFGDGEKSNGYAYKPSAEPIDKFMRAGEYLTFDETYWLPSEFGFDSTIYINVEFRNIIALSIFNNVFKVVDGYYLVNGEKIFPLNDEGMNAALRELDIDWP
jgi:hypothetical protein